MKRQHPPEYPRKSPRLQGYDYTQNGAYFVTICTHDRVNLFGHVSEGVMHLNAYGEVAQDCWQQIPAHFPHVELDLFVVMPNHVHGIIVIVDDPPKRQKTPPAVGTQHAASLPNRLHGATRNNVQSGSLSAIVRSYKSAVTRTINRMTSVHASPIWQGRYHDHIIRDERGLNTLRQYVLANPVRWENDTFWRED